MWDKLGGEVVFESVVQLFADNETNYGFYDLLTNDRGLALPSVDRL